MKREESTSQQVGMVVIYIYRHGGVEKFDAW